MDTVQPTSRVTAANADARPLAAAPRRPLDDEDSRRGSRGAPPTGAVRGAVIEALAANGVELPRGQVARADDVADDSPVPAAAELRRDLSGLMHELHEAVKTAGRGDAEGEDAETEGGNGRRSFADGLGALVSEVTAGRTPEGLQSAFDRILGDVGNAGSQPSLVGFLTKLQALLGYGGGGEALSPAATGNLVSFKA
jgi:hypothetical protein